MTIPESGGRDQPEPEGDDRQAASSSIAPGQPGRSATRAAAQTRDPIAAICATGDSLTRVATGDGLVRSWDPPSDRPGHGPQGFRREPPLDPSDQGVAEPPGEPRGPRDRQQVVPDVALAGGPTRTRNRSSPVSTCPGRVP